MSDIEQYSQLIQEIRQLIDELDIRIDTLHSLILVASDKAEEKEDSECIKVTAEDLRKAQAESKFNKEIDDIVRRFDADLNDSYAGHLKIKELEFMAREFPAMSYIDRIIEIYNSREGYKAYFANYNDPFYDNVLYIIRKK